MQAIDRFTALLDGRAPNDGLLAAYIKHLHDEGKAPSTRNVAVAALNSVSRYAGLPRVRQCCTLQKR